MKIMKAKIVWFPEKLSSIDFDSLENKMGSRTFKNCS